MLTEIDYFPLELLELDAHQLASQLPGPTLIHLDGHRKPALFVSVLLHGNETVGWLAVQQLLKRYLNREGVFTLPRALSLYIGNVTAAAQGVRRLDGQPDYNRVWPGSELSASKEQAMMQQVVDLLAQRTLFASVDLHNNTGINPHYACINRLDHSFIYLGSLFGRTLVYFLRPTGVQSMALAKLCPAVTLECGKVGHRHGVEHAVEYLDACLHLSEIPHHPLPANEVDLFHTVAQVRVREGVSFTFTSQPADVRFCHDLDHLNFQELAAGTLFGELQGDIQQVLEAKDDQGNDVTERFFYLDERRICLSSALMPAMLTTDERVIQQDCLCYLMERYDRHLSDAT